MLYEIVKKGEQLVCEKEVGQVLEEERRVNGLLVGGPLVCESGRDVFAGAGLQRGTAKASAQRAAGPALVNSRKGVR